MDPRLIRDCRLLGRTGRFDVVVADKRIAAVRPGGVTPPEGNVLDAAGQLLVPGFLEVHIQGAGGADVLDATPEALATIARTSARYGVTGFLATTVFKPGQANRHLAVAAAHVGADLGGARLLGLHLEGPFIAAGKRGMIQPDCIGPATPETLGALERLCGPHLRMMTLAPERPDGDEVIAWLQERGIIASLGHTQATYEQTCAAFDAGVRHVTHLFNAMPGIHHRAPGPLTAIFERPEVTTQVITDGVHIHPAVLRQALRLLKPERIVTITDGMQALGLPPGRYTYNGIEYESRDGAARYHDGTLIGTAVGLSDLVRRLVEFTGLDPAVALATVTSQPARLLGLADRFGRVAPGYEADLVLLGEDLRVRRTLVAGRLVYEA